MYILINVSHLLFETEQKYEVRYIYPSVTFHHISNFYSEPLIIVLSFIRDHLSAIHHMAYVKHLSMLCSKILKPIIHMPNNCDLPMCILSFYGHIHNCTYSYLEQTQFNC